MARLGSGGEASLNLFVSRTGIEWGRSASTMDLSIVKRPVSVWSWIVPGQDTNN